MTFKRESSLSRVIAGAERTRPYVDDLENKIHFLTLTFFWTFDLEWSMLPGIERLMYKYPTFGQLFVFSNVNFFSCLTAAQQSTAFLMWRPPANMTLARIKLSGKITKVALYRVCLLDIQLYLEEFGISHTAVKKYQIDCTMHMFTVLHFTVTVQ